jgi:hypothetical protein
VISIRFTQTCLKLRTSTPNEKTVLAKIDDSPATAANLPRHEEKKKQAD